MASMARNMERENFTDLWRPKTDLLLMEGKRSYHLNQYPFPSVFAGWGHHQFGGSYEFWGRFQAILFNLLSILLLFFMSYRLFNETVAWITATIFGLSPYTLIYGQSFMSEAFALFLFLAAMWVLVRRNQISFFSISLAGFLLSASLTGRIHFVLFFPVFILILWSKRASFTSLAMFSFFAFLMPAIWYGHTYHASGHWTNVHTSVFLQLGMPSSHADLSLTECGRKIIRLFLIMLTPLLLPFFLLGWKPLWELRKNLLFVISGIFCGALLSIVFFRKVMDHDFYLYAAFPFVVLTTALGVERIWERFPILQRKFMVLFQIALYLGCSVFLARNALYNIPGDEVRLVKTGREVRDLVPVEDRLVVASVHPAVFLYYVDRPAWNMTLTNRELDAYRTNPKFKKKEAAALKELEAAMKNAISWLQYYRSKGASYLVAPEKHVLERESSFLAYLKANFRQISTSVDDFYLFRL